MALTIAVRLGSLFASRQLNPAVRGSVQIMMARGHAINMELFTLLYRHALWILAMIFVGAVYLLISCIRKVIRLRTEMQILAAPVVEEQEIEFAEAGKVVVCVEGPIFTRRFARADFELISHGGAPVPGKTAMFHASSSSLTRVRMEMKKYDIPMPGRYILRIIDPGGSRPNDTSHRIVFVRPHLAVMMACVLGIVFSAVLSIGSLVLFLIRLLVKS
jgi:hypothetical protein